MFIEDYIIFRVNALLHAHDAKIVMRLEGGMSNYTYVVECQGKKYTYRVPGKFARSLWTAKRNGPIYRKSAAWD